MAPRQPKVPTHSAIQHPHFCSVTYCTYPRTSKEIVAPRRARALSPKCLLTSSPVVHRQPPQPRPQRVHGGQRRVHLVPVY